MAIDGYPINGYQCLLMVIVLVAIGDYYQLLMVIILMVIGGYFVGGY